jgi:5-methylcytosine-specific restriction endonuclease McrA
MKKTGVDTNQKKKGKIDRKKLILELDALASQVCRIIWNHKCAMCGGAGSQTHHFFTKRAHGATRWDLDGLIWLCFGCHIYKVHSKGDTETIRDAIIKRTGIVRFNSLKVRAAVVRKYSMVDLLDIRGELKRELMFEDLPF